MNQNNCENIILACQAKNLQGHFKNDVPSPKPYIPYLSFGHAVFI